MNATAAFLEGHFAIPSPVDAIRFEGLVLASRKHLSKAAPVAEKPHFLLRKLQLRTDRLS